VPNAAFRQSRLRSEGTDEFAGNAKRASVRTEAFGVELKESSTLSVPHSRLNWVLRTVCLIAACFLPYLLQSQEPRQTFGLHDVNVFLGADGAGHTTPGAQVPFGFVVLQPDTERPSTAGYRSSERILGFSSTHVSGTGGATKYGNFRVTPSMGPPQLPVSAEKFNEIAWPGYYAVMLGSPTTAIHAELTASRLVGFHRYTFPKAKDAQLMIEVSSVIVNWGGTPQRAVSCTAQADIAGMLTGSCRFRGGWNPSPYQLYFAAKFDRMPISTGVSHGSDVSRPVKQVSTSREWEPVWAWATFDTSRDPTVEMKLAVSFLSVDKAKSNLQEVETWNFDHARRQAEEQWSAALGKIRVEGGTSTQRGILLSSLYRAQVMPHDLTGENVWWDSSEPHYEDFYTLWDTFRTQDPLLILIDSDRARDLVRSLVDTYRHSGWLPDARIAGSNGMTQGGSNGDVLVADAIVKGLRGFDYNLAYDALVKDADTASADPTYYGREDTSQYKKLGYLPLEDERSGSRTMEYSYDDFAVAQVARVLGRNQESAEFLRRSLFWTNLWDKDTLSIHPRHADGTWEDPFDRTILTKSWQSPFYEGTPWEYSTYVPHDVQGLINRTGGDHGFVSWLDQFFAQNQYDPGNEPDMLAPWLYIHAGRPDRTQALVRQQLAKYYRLTRDGLPGNDDAGAMSSWYVWASIGLYPNAGQDYYYVGSPLFRRVRITVGEGRFFIIEASQASSANRYIQSATLNGRRLERAWLTHSEIMGGGTLKLDLGPSPSIWGRNERPYSVESSP
jgi:predicted alpha-1,2-mannosidase